MRAWRMDWAAWILPTLLTVWSSAEPAAAQPLQKIDVAYPGLSAETDWPWWRGPSSMGHAAAASKPPTSWSVTQNIVWKSPVPGRGHSSPTVVGNRVFLTTADEAEQVQAVVAFDRETGRPLWKTDVSRGGFPKTHGKNTHATPTAACDGERLFVVFHHHNTLQAVALSLDGQVQWNQSLGTYHPQRYEYGYAPSPVLYRDTVIVAAEFDGVSSIRALDRKTGRTVWTTPRPSNISFSTPLVYRIGARDLLLISGAGLVACYDPTDGKPQWAVEGTTAATCGTMVADGDVLFASGGYPKAETIAVRAANDGPTAGGSTSSATTLWKNQAKCYEQSMIAVDGYLYAFTDNGVLYCFRGSDGAEMWRERLQGPVSASPIYAGGCIYWSNERGTTYVFRPNPQRLEAVAENVLGDESFASPAVGGDQLFLRVADSSSGKRQEYLMCLGAR